MGAASTVLVGWLVGVLGGDPHERETKKTDKSPLPRGYEKASSESKIKIMICRGLVYFNSLVCSLFGLVFLVKVAYSVLLQPT